MSHTPYFSQSCPGRHMGESVEGSKSSNPQGTMGSHADRYGKVRKLFPLISKPTLDTWRKKAVFSVLDVVCIIMVSSQCKRTRSLRDPTPKAPISTLIMAKASTRSLVTDIAPMIIKVRHMLLRPEVFTQQTDSVVRLTRH